MKTAITLILLALLAGCGGHDDRVNTLVLPIHEWGCAQYSKRIDRQHSSCVQWVDLEWIEQINDQARRAEKEDEEKAETRRKEK